MAQWLMNPTRNHEVAGSVPGLGTEIPHQATVRYGQKKSFSGVPVMAQWLTNPTRNHEVAGSVPALAQWVNNLALL